MKILPDIEVIDLALYIDSTIVIADVHIGYEEVLNKQGVLVPRVQLEDMVKRIGEVFDCLKGRKIERIVINGDLKHEFGTISEQEWRNTLKFLDFLSKHCNEVILIKGNHDTILGPIAKKRDVKVMDFCIIEPSTLEKNTINKISNLKSKKSIKETLIKNTLKNKKLTKKSKNKILIAHGDKVPDKSVLNDVSTIIIGHEHPAVSIREGPRIEKYKCFLVGKYKRKNLIVQPSFNTMIEGTDILKDEILSPFLKQNLDNFEVFVVEDKVYGFGKLKNLMKD
ncbi:phosphoesterase [Candidatus Woesearchaeota archaeon]|jgi:hypothetical protein|nr:phosphoesterase [Candidatus Woesearchaeota archaeon]MDP6648339.1 metallophosphoesterase [Candidatus Woesearchaeota archaeon]|tara:strand:- start:9156 stop:9998 length:843 start_codon:yes stop_codon:yes gene_type:complete